jgi:NADPH:quinone reductase-like Zn-dependent oxidoreductase
MKAVVQDEYGSSDVLHLDEVEKPVPGDDDVLIRVNAASIHIGDCHMMRGMPYIMRPIFGLRRPKDRIPGTDVAGTVEAIGKNVTHFRPGDEVFGWCKGAFAEYVSVSEDALALKPANLTLEQSAAIGVSAFTALQALRDQGKVQPGQKVLINGASGGVGTFAVQIAKILGAEVTGVCSTRNVEMVRSIGADHVIDYTLEDFTQGDERYDLIIDNVGSHSLSETRHALVSDGKLVPNGAAVNGWFGGIDHVFIASIVSLFVRRQGRPFLSLPNQADLATLKEYTESGKVMPVIDRTYPLTEAPEALGYVAEGHARGKVVIALCIPNI